MGNEKPFVLHDLAPEAYLVATLPPKWQQRFQVAIKCIDKMLFEGDRLIWEDIAKRSAISPHHFHRMFTLVFNETPGQYMTRKRLQFAVMLIVSEPDFTVTEIAHETGFSSSQALAKALKRTLGLSAKEIKSDHRQYNVFEALMRKLGQPVAVVQQSLEEQMAENIAFEVRHFPERLLVTKPLKTTSLWEMERTWLEMKPRGEHHSLVNLMQLDFDGDDVDVRGMEVGYFCGDSRLVNERLAKGHYLCGRICVKSLNAYFAAWDALFLHALTQDLIPDEQSKCIEIIDEPELDSLKATDMLISIRLMDE
jgi:AraC family transcriptional regulator